MQKFVISILKFNFIDFFENYRNQGKWKLTGEMGKFNFTIEVWISHRINGIKNNMIEMQGFYHVSMTSLAIRSDDSVPNTSLSHFIFYSSKNFQFRNKITILSLIHNYHWIIDSHLLFIYHIFLLSHSQF